MGAGRQPFAQKLVHDGWRMILSDMADDGEAGRERARQAGSRASISVRDPVHTSEISGKRVEKGRRRRGMELRSGSDIIAPT